MASQITYEDQWGEIIDRPQTGFLEIRWYDTTVQMTAEQFNDWLTEFATAVERAGRPGCLVDSLAFRMDPALMDSAWRDANIIPRYNAAGVKRFAFLMPEGMPLTGTPPAPEDPGNFPTGYFGTREGAVDWLSGA